MKPLVMFGLVPTLTACAAPFKYDTVLRGGTIYDGTGAPGVVGDIARSTGVTAEIYHFKASGQAN